MTNEIIAQPTLYNGIQFRSKLEAKTAQVLDSLGIAWVFEPQGYKLSNGMWYKPDFWLPVAHQFIECKGNMTEKDSAKIVGLVEDTSYPVLVLSYENAMLCVKWTYDKTNEIATFFSDDLICVGQCYKCGGRFFYAEYGSYKCQCCGYYDGDHTLCQIAEVKSASQLFNYAQETVAVNNPLYKQISDKFNQEV